MTSICAGIRRCHDPDLSGLLALVMFIPLAGFFVAAYLALMSSKAGTGRYGAAPAAGPWVPTSCEDPTRRAPTMIAMVASMVLFATMFVIARTS